MKLLDFRPMNAADLPQYATWRQQPHVVEWWPVETLEEIEEEFEEEEYFEAESLVKCFFILLDGRSIGFIQSYQVKDAGDGWWEEIDDPGVYGMDLFIGEADLLGQGLGTRIIQQFSERLLAEPHVTLLQIDPDVENGRAIRCYEKAGFVQQGVIETPDGLVMYMIRDWNR